MSNLTSLEYILKLFQVSADQLHIDYVKETPTRLQNWSTKNKPPYIAFINRTDSAVNNDAYVKIKTYVCDFVVITSNERDMTNDKYISNLIDAENLSDSFVEFIDKNEDVQNLTFTKDELFRDSSYLGSGVGLSVTFSIVDKKNYCDIFCNTQTEKLDCSQ
jgi:hypothetical protein